MTGFNNTSRIRRFCLMRINGHHGFQYMNGVVGHKKIAFELFSLGWVDKPRVIGQKTARKMMKQYYERENGSEITIPKTKKSVKKQKPKRKKAFLNSWEWRTLRYEILQKYDRRCMCCGASPDDGRTSIHVDHIKPRFRYPELALSEDNLQVLCGVCNQGKGAWDETDFRENRTEYDEHIENVVQIELARQAKESQ
jgi:5-methylcytosine-specific restriction endonuclease McrA